MKRLSKSAVSGQWSAANASVRVLKTIDPGLLTIDLSTK